MPLPVTNAAAQRVWGRYEVGQPEWMPVALRIGDRVYMLDAHFNWDGLT
ncbi:MAG: hypothetical protein NZ765_10345 [Anaerolineae bacterium]|nr:hypothetical protein [Anaerolineae bacterium]MDW8071471.1 hypothetical protein [Anaerolineae bacterium]